MEKKNNQKSLIGSELESMKQKKDVVAVHMIGRQILVMTSQTIHICRNDYSDVESMILI